MALDFPAAPTNGQTFAAPNGVTYTFEMPPGRWNDAGEPDVANPGYTVTPEDYGALGNGVAGTDTVPATGTDDSAAFQAALDYLVSVGGGTLSCGPKRYMLDLPDNLNISVNLSNITIQGVPGRTVLDFSRTVGYYNGAAGPDGIVRPNGFIRTEGTKHDGTTTDAPIMLISDTIAAIKLVGMVAAGTRSGSTITITTDAPHGLATGNLVWVHGDPDITGEDIFDEDGVLVANSQQCFYTTNARTTGKTIPVPVATTPTPTSFTFIYTGDLTGQDTVIDMRSRPMVTHASDVMSVPNSALFKIGERVLLGSLREHGRRDSEHVNIGEYQTVANILTPTLVRFHGDVRETYAVADGARVFKLTQIVNTTFEGLTIIGKGANFSALPSQRGDVALSLQHTHNLTVSKCTFHYCDLMSVFIFYSSKATIKDNTIYQDQRDAGGRTSGVIDLQYGFNYGVAVDDIVFDGNSVYGGRHAIVQGGSSAEADFGIGRNVRITNNYCSGQWLEAISTHLGADTIIFSHNYITGARGGINPRYSKNVIITNNLLTVQFNGIILYNDVHTALISGNVIDAGSYPISIKSIDNPTDNAMPDGYIGPPAPGNANKLSSPTPAGPSIQITGNQIRNGRNGIYCVDTTAGLVLNGLEITDNSIYNSRNEAIWVSIGNGTADSRSIAATGSSYDNATGLTTLVLSASDTRLIQGVSFTLSAMAGSDAISVGLLNGEHKAITPTSTVDTVAFTAASGLGTITITPGGTIALPTGESYAILSGTYDNATGGATVRMSAQLPDLVIGNPFTLSGLQGTGASALNGAQTASAATVSTTTITFKDTPGNGATTVTGGTLTLSLGGWTGTVSNNRFYDCCLTQSTYQLRFSNAQRVKINDNLLLGTSTYAYAMWLEGDTTTACEMMGNTVAPTLYATAVIHPAFFGTGHKTDMFFREDVQVIGGVAALKCVTTRHLRLRMETGTADDLDSITGAGIDQELTLSTQATGWVITVKHGAGFELDTNTDKVLNNRLDKMKVIWSTQDAKFVQLTPLMDHA